MGFIRGDIMVFVNILIIRNYTLEAKPSKKILFLLSFGHFSSGSVGMVPVSKDISTKDIGK